MTRLENQHSEGSRTPPWRHCGSTTTLSHAVAVSFIAWQELPRSIQPFWPGVVLYWTSHLFQVAALKIQTTVAKVPESPRRTNENLLPAHESAILSRTNPPLQANSA
jgi:hypothetical protein